MSIFAVVQMMFVMSDKLTKEMTVGELVADNFDRAKVLDQLGIDYCCGGKATLGEACEKRGLKPETVLAKLETPELGGEAVNFSKWPSDLLLDYVLKYHHRNFHLHNEELLNLVKKVENVHGDRHPELHDVRESVEASFEDLDSHFAKEEQVLFPQLYEIYNAREEGRQEGFRQAAEPIIKCCYAGIILALHDEFGFGENRAFRAIKAVDEKIIWALNHSELCDEVLAKTGLELLLDEPFERVQKIEK